jgi:hypothetical protein
MAELPEEVERFIDAHVENLAQLEILLLLRAHRERAFHPREVTFELRLGPDSAAQRLAGLQAQGLVVAEGERFRFQPDGVEKERAVDELALCYARRKVSVIERIFAPRPGARRTAQR